MLLVSLGKVTGPRFIILAYNMLMQMKSTCKYWPFWIVYLGRLLFQLLRHLLRKLVNLRSQIIMPSYSLDRNQVQPRDGFICGDWITNWNRQRRNSNFLEFIRNKIHLLILYCDQKLVDTKVGKLQMGCWCTSHYWVNSLTGIMPLLLLRYFSDDYVIAIFGNNGCTCAKVT